MKTTLAQWGLGLRKQFAPILYNTKRSGFHPRSKPNQQNETIQIFRTLQKRFAHKIGASIASSGGRIWSQGFVAHRPVQRRFKVRWNISKKTLLTIPTRFDYSTTLMNITEPTVHSNGTAYKDLWQGYEAAYNAIRSAQEALSKIEFNGRDYYVKDDDAFTKARDHRDDQFTALGQVEEYLLQHLLSLQKQER